MMKLRAPLSRLLAACLPLAGIARAGEPETPPPDLSTRVPGPLTGGRFVPPPPPPPPKLVPHDMRVESAVVHKLPGRTLTLLRGEPSTRPDFPEPAPSPVLTAEQAAARDAFLARHRPPVQLMLGATIYDHGSISYVHWNHPEDPHARYEAAVGLDFALFSNIHSFLYQGVPHHLFLFSTEIDTTGLRQRFGWHSPLSHHLVPAEGFLILKGDPQDAAGTAPLRVLMDLYAVEKDRLIRANLERRQALREAAEWARRNPKPKGPASHTYWVRPHRGSRYLAVPAPQPSTPGSR